MIGVGCLLVGWPSRRHVSDHSGCCWYNDRCTKRSITK